MHCFDMLMGVAMRYVSNKEEAIERVNSSFIKILKSLTTYQSTKPFDPWAKRILINDCLDALRSQKRWSEQFMHASDWEGDPLESEGDVAWDWVDQEYLDHLMTELKPFERAVFLGVALDGFTHSEMAKMHGVSERTSKRALQSARAQLAERINNKTLKRA